MTEVGVGAGEAVFAAAATFIAGPFVAMSNLATIAASRSS